MVAIHEAELICARCHVEVIQKQPKPESNMTLSSDQRFAPLTPLYPLRSNEKQQANSCDESPAPSNVRQYRFDAAHKARTQPMGRNIECQESTSPLAASDSPRLLSMLALFFVGQALVVWAYFQGNVNALGCGMVVSIAAVGLALQAQKRKRHSIAPTSSEPLVDNSTPITLPAHMRAKRRSAAPSDSAGW
ncbi:MAG: hypothetical protein ABL888_21005 [Pirellulaceae bacterium]